MPEKPLHWLDPEGARSSDVAIVTIEQLKRAKLAAEDLVADIHRLQEMQTTYPRQHDREAVLVRALIDDLYEILVNLIIDTT